MPRAIPSTAVPAIDYRVFAFAAAAVIVVTLFLIAWLIVFLWAPARERRAHVPSPTALFDFRPVLRNRSAMAYALAYCAHTWEMNSLRGWAVAFLTYVATTTNFGPSGAQGVAISNSIPANTKYLSSSLCSLSGGCSSNSCSFAAGTAMCTVGNLDKFGLEFMLVTVQVMASPGTVLSDKATVSAFNPDPDRVPDRSWTMKTLVTRY